MEDAPLASLARRASEPVTREYHPRNILLTGGCGFIGSHVVTHLATKYPSYNITVLDKLDYCAAKGHLDEIGDRAGMVVVFVLFQCRLHSWLAYPSIIFGASTRVVEFKKSEDWANTA